MLVKSQVKEISERELEDLIRQQPDLVEEGLLIIDQQKITQNLENQGRLDVLFVDSDNTLIIAELKIKENDRMLSQAIDYFDYINDNKEIIARLYSEKKTNINPSKEPRILLIAPSFSKTLINRCKWISIDIQLKRYLHLELEDAAKNHTIFFEEVNSPYNLETVEVKTNDDHLDYIKDEKVKSFAKKLFDEVKQWDESRISFTPKKSGISMKLSGRVFGAYYPRRKYFMLHFLEDENFVRHDVKEEADLELAKIFLKQSFDSINSIV